MGRGAVFKRFVNDMGQYLGYKNVKIFELFYANKHNFMKVIWIPFHLTFLSSSIKIKPYL